MTDIVLISIPEAKIRHIVEQSVKSALNAHKSESDPEPNERVVDLDGLIKARPFIGCKSTIYKKVSRCEIPHSKNGKRLIFDLNAVDKWLLSNKVKSKKEIEAASLHYLNTRKRKRRS